MNLNWTITNDWYKYSFAFLPAYQSVIAESFGVTNYTYMLNGKFGGIYSSDVYAQMKEIYWDSYQIRVKVPAEHMINNVKYDLELQVLHKDYYNRA